MSAFLFPRRVEFHETDAAGLVHFSNYFRYAEAAEHALYRELEHPMMLQEGYSFFGWPRVRAQAKYSAPLYSGDLIRVELGIAELKDRSIDFQFKIFREADNVLASKGTFTTVHVVIDGTNRAMKSVPTAGFQPSSLRRRKTQHLLHYLMENRQDACST
jgi:acyl-CoA thioester hydrolase